MNDNQISKKEIAPLASGVIESLLIRGDLSKLGEQQRLSYYQNLCQSLNLNPLTKPFEYIQLNGKLVLYVTRSCTDQLRSVHKVSIKITKRDLNENFYAVTAIASTSDGRTDESIGVTSIIGLKADALANAIMKGETKAKRRVTLSICGLGFLDESERHSVSHAEELSPPTAEEIYSGERQPIDYTIPFGKYMNRHLEEVGEEKLISYIEYIRGKAQRQGKEITGQVLDFITKAELYVEEKFLEKEVGEFDKQFKDKLK